MRHAHHRVIRGAVAMRMVFAQHIAHHAGALHRLGAVRAIAAAKRQAHAVHGINDAPLHRLLPIAHIGQSAALDHAQRIFQIRTLRVLREIQAISAFAAGHGFVALIVVFRVEIESGLIGHCFASELNLFR